MKFGLLALLIVFSFWANTIDFASAFPGPNLPVILCLGLIVFLALRAWNRGRLGQDRLSR
jgi:hypothetical protein